MKISIKQVLGFIAFLLFLNFFSILHVSAAQVGCYQAADDWILQLNDEKNSELFHRYTHGDCQFSGKWVKQLKDGSSRAQRERMCQDLVLIWSHKNCNFFRDLINPEAYEPCKAWTREMHQHCMENDVNWFP